MTTMHQPPPSAPEEATPLAVSLADVEDAAERIRGQVDRTPLSPSPLFSERCGCKVTFKLESLQMTGSYKERGALNFLSQLSPELRARGVVAASAGNHAQGVAHHAQRLGIDATIVMPEGTPLIKVRRTRLFGGRVVLHGSGLTESLEHARLLCDTEGRTFIPPFDHPHIIAGQGTVGLELLEQLPYLDAVVVPIGGGGLLAGMAVAIKEVNPRVKLYGVETAAVPKMKAAVEHGAPTTIPGAPTLADGIAVRRAGDLTYPIIDRYVDDIFTVNEAEIADAILQLLEDEKVVAEGAGAVAVAAMLQRPAALASRRVACLITGGNIDVNLLSLIIERGLVAQGRRVRMTVTTIDRPGGLSRLTDLVAKMSANVLQIQHDRTFNSAPLGMTTIELTLETKGPDHADEVAAALRDAGYELVSGGPTGPG